MPKVDKRIKAARRPYRERGQVAGRERLGLLEKHEDYVVRARQYHAKTKRLQALREKARLRNPDEFYHRMSSTRTRGGVHVSERNDAFPPETIKLLKTQDANYITLKTTQEKKARKKIERLRASLHGVRESDASTSRRLATCNGTGDENADDEEMDDDNEDDDEDGQADGTSAAASAVPRARHLVFVDSDDEVEKFDAAKHFDTLPELVNRRSNRPRVAALAAKPLVAGVPARELKRVEKLRAQSYEELEQRSKRVQALERAGHELETQRHLMAKGRRRKVGTDSLGLPVYRWAAERKK